MRDVLGTIGDIERHGDQAHTQCRLIEYDPLRRIFQHDGHTVTGMESFMRHGGLPARDLVFHLLPGELAPFVALVVEITIGDFVWRAASALMEQAIQRDGNICGDEVGFHAHVFLPEMWFVIVICRGAAVCQNSTEGLNTSVVVLARTSLSAPEYSFGLLQTKPMSSVGA